MSTALLPYQPGQNPLHHTIARVVVRGVQDAFNARDPEALASHFAEVAAWTGVAGKRLHGRAEIAAFGRVAMPQMGESFARYEMTNLLAIQRDVLAVNVLQTPTDRQGNTLAGAQGITLYIIARGPDGWKIVAGQNSFLFNDKVN